jgi:hypothetical protein
VVVGLSVGVFVTVGVMVLVTVGVVVTVGVIVGVIVVVGVTVRVVPGVEVTVGVIVEVTVGVVVGVIVGDGLGPGTQVSLSTHAPPNRTTLNPGVLGTCEEHTYTVSSAATESVPDSPLPAHGVYVRFFGVPSLVAE